MARKKDPPKPLFGLKHDFFASVENVGHEAIMLLQAVDMAIKNGGLDPAISGILKERSASMRAALMSED
jgi:hypothetical protein